MNTRKPYKEMTEPELLQERNRLNEIRAHALVTYRAAREMLQKVNESHFVKIVEIDDIIAQRKEITDSPQRKSSNNKGMD